MVRILIIDDEGTVLQSLGILLESEGHEIIPVNDSKKAIDIIKTEKYDLLITDIRMSPVDGIELLKLAHETRPSTPLIVISAFTSDKVAEKGYEVGCTAYIKKPFKVNETLDVVNKALEGK